jgi:cytochrome bd-type quinol oxidase subunit 2
MDLRRLRAGEWIAAIGGVALLVALFLPWYDEGAASPTGWESFAVLDVIFALVGVAAVLLLVVTAQQRSPALPLAMASLLTLGSVVVLVLAVFRVIDLPSDASARDAGVWLALAASLAIFAGGALAMRDERLSTGGRHVDLTGRPTPEPPEIEAWRAPRPGQ